MARPRSKKSDNWLPPGVKLAKGRYIIRSKLTHHKEVRLCAGNATQSQVWLVYETFLDKNQNTLDKLCTDYCESHTYNNLSKSTQALYRHCHNSLKKVTFNRGQRFLNLQPEQITPGVLRQILDTRATQGAAVMGNREIKGFLSAVFSWSIERDLINLKENPCHAVRRNTEIPDTRYVEDWEYALALNHSGWLYNVLELAYLLYARISEVLELTKQDIRPDGIFVNRLKGSKSNVVRWSPRLQAAVESATNDKNTCAYLLQKDGNRVTYSMILKPWKKMMQVAKEERPDFEPFNRHHLKAKGISDNERPQNSAGHRSKEIEETYKRKIERVDPPK